MTIRTTAPPRLPSDGSRVRADGTVRSPSAGRTYWEVDGRRCDTIDQLREELARIARDPGRQIDDAANPGKHKLPAVVIEPYPGTYYDDCARAADAAKEAGFTEVSFGGGLGAK